MVAYIALVAAPRLSAGRTHKRNGRLLLSMTVVRRVHGLKGLHVFIRTSRQTMCRRSVGCALLTTAAGFLIAGGLTKRLP